MPPNRAERSLIKYWIRIYKKWYAGVILATFILIITTSLFSLPFLKALEWRSLDFRLSILPVPQKPLSDSKISDLLKKEGLGVARRTVAKYRENLGIPSSSRRKSF